MSTTDTATAAFRMLKLTKSQTETAAKGLALFRQIAKEAQLGDWIDAVARFTQPLELAEALEQIHADLLALHSRTFEPEPSSGRQRSKQSVRGSITTSPPPPLTANSCPAA